MSIGWVRIQLTIRLRPQGGPADGAAGPAEVSLALVRTGAPGAAGRAAIRMPATRARWEDGELVARFNVMQGPGQMPLAPGTWQLVTSASDGGGGGQHAGGWARDIRVVDPNGIAAGQPAAVFETPRGRYEVALRDASGTEIVLDVALGGQVAPEQTANGGQGSPAAIAATRRIASSLKRWLFRSAIRLLRPVATRRRPAILFTSSTRPALGGNLAVVHDRMVERGLRRDVDILLSFKPDIHAPTPLLERIRSPWLFARPDVIVLDDFHPLVGGLDARVRIIQLWHASGVVKTILYSRVGKPGGLDPWSRDYKNYAHAIVSSEHDVPHFAEAFGIPEDRVVPTGIPRMDRFFDEQAREAGRAAALEAFPAARGRRVILFAPTFRGAGRTKSYDLEVLRYPELHALCVEKDAVFIIRLHPRMRRPLGIPPELGDRILDGSDVATDAPDILFATDLLITDYSSIIFEFATLGRPMLFFAPDLDTYRESVDFYEPYEELVPGKVVRTLDELVEAIRTEDFEQERLDPFVARHIAHLDGKATDRVIDQLILPGLRRA